MREREMNERERQTDNERERQTDNEREREIMILKRVNPLESLEARIVIHI